MGDIPNETGKKRCIDDIIEHMTADFQSYEGQYILLGSPPTTGPVWTTDYTPQPPVFYQPPLRAENNEMMMMDMGGGKYVNVVFSKHNNQDYNQHMGFIHYPQQQQQQQSMVQSQNYQTSNFMPPQLIDYGQRNFSETAVTNGCLIENVVGNWAPNRNGTYSPFGNIPQDDKPLPVASISPSPQPALAPVKKHRIVAEVKPMRPSYSDVLAKSPPLTPPPVTKQAANYQTAVIPPVKVESVKKHSNKTATLNSNRISSNLKRQSSSGSDEALADKGKNSFKKWASQEEISSPLKCSFPVEPIYRNEYVKKEKKKKIKGSKQVSDKEEKFDLGNKPVEVPAKPFKKTSSLSNPPHKISPQERYTSLKPKLRDDRKNSSKTERGQGSKTNTKLKRTQRIGKKRDSSLGALWKKWQEQSSYYVVLMMTWLINLLWDVTAMSASLLVHMFCVVCEQGMDWLNGAKSRCWVLLKKCKWWGKKEKGKFPKKPPLDTPPLPGSLTHNINLPTTGEEAMKRLLSCKGKDPYSILGVTSACTDEEIKKYYKSQALLVHPDKNSQPGAEEAFKILVHAFDLIAEPEKRAAYDRYVAETNQVEQAWSELSDLLSQLHEKMEYAANTIRCNNCGKRHKRELTNRPSYAARFCAQCKIHHSAKEGDMWAESRGWGWWSCRYYACMEGAVYDITQWANCQGNSIQRVKPDSHTVQYRVLMGRAPNQQPPPEPDFEDLLNSLYSQNGTGCRGRKKSKKTK